MKKLNITKERFEKSRYFNKKYGKLEYVSENGKLFKTNKGKVLKFKESCNKDKSFESVDKDLDNPESLVKFIQKLPNGNDYLFEDNGKWVVTNEWICGTFSGRGFEGDTPEEAASKLIDYLNKHVGHKSLVGTQVSKSGWPNAQRVKEFVATPDDEEKTIDESRKFGRKFSESDIDISEDPAYRCPYCGGRNTEFNDCQDVEDWSDGVFDGATFNATWHCMDCLKIYDVQFTMGVTKVAPSGEL